MMNLEPQLPVPHEITTLVCLQSGYEISLEIHGMSKILGWNPNVFDVNISQQT